MHAIATKPIDVSESGAPPATLAHLLGASKRYGKVLALDHVDLEIRAGEIFGLLGPNGAGKTTALGLLMGLRQADAGNVALFGRDPRDLVARRQIGVMLQEAKLPDTLTVVELIRQFSGYYPLARRIIETLNLSGLGDLAHRRYGALSGGQQRRVQFALAICGRPRLLFVDEPTTGLDVEARRMFWNVLRALTGEGVSIVLTTHYLEEADALADRIVLLANGRILAQGTPAQIKAHAAGKRVRCVTSVASSALSSWPGVDEVAQRAGITELRTNDAESVLRKLLAADPQLSGLEVLPLALDDAFLALTNGFAAREAA